MPTTKIKLTKKLIEELKWAASDKEHELVITSKDAIAILEGLTSTGRKHA